MYAARIVLDHLGDAIARWTMEEQGARQRALQGVIQLYRLYGFISTERTYHLCRIAMYNLALCSKFGTRRRGSMITAVLFVLLVPFFEC